MNEWYQPTREGRIVVVSIEEERHLQSFGKWKQINDWQLINGGEKAGIHMSSEKECEQEASQCYNRAPEGLEAPSTLEGGMTDEWGTKQDWLKMGTRDK